MTSKHLRNIFIGGAAAAVLLFTGFCTATSISGDDSDSDDSGVSAQSPDPTETATEAATEEATPANEPTTDDSEEPTDPDDGCNSIVQCGGEMPDHIAPNPTPEPECGSPSDCVGADDFVNPTPEPECGSPSECNDIDDVAIPEVTPGPDPTPQPDPWIHPNVDPKVNPDLKPVGGIVFGG